MYLFLICFIMNSIVLYDFTEQSNIDDWKIVDDGVMGGLSESQMTLDQYGNAVFSGFLPQKITVDFARCNIILNQFFYSKKHCSVFD